MEERALAAKKNILAKAIENDRSNKAYTLDLETREFVDVTDARRVERLNALDKMERIDDNCKN